MSARHLHDASIINISYIILLYIIFIIINFLQRFYKVQRFYKFHNVNG